MSILQKIYHQEKGPEEGPRIVFIHGLMGYAANWSKVISLIPFARCLTYDQRGHGRSFHADLMYSPHDYAQDLKDLVDALGWKKFVLVGHSMGGRNALVFAHTYPSYVSRLLIEDIGPESVEGAYKYYEDLLGVVPVPFSDRAMAKKFFENEFSQKAHVRENVGLIGQFLYSNLRDLENGQVTWRFDQKGIIDTVKQGRQNDYWKMLQELQCPTLIIRGERSPELTQPTYEKMLRQNPKIQGAIIPNAGHWVHVEQTQLFTDKLKEFAGIGTTTTSS